MTTYLALLRGINVGGHKKVAMSDLRELCTDLGLDDARTILQSGNLVFRTKTRTPASLESLLETAVKKELELETRFFVRTVPEWKDAMAGNPFCAEAERDPGHLLLMFLKDAPQAKQVKALQAAIRGREIVRANGRHAYFVYPDGVGTSRLTINVIEKHFGTQGTARNWNTVAKMAALADS